MHSSRKMFSKSPYFFPVHHFLLLLSLNTVLTLATDTISQGQSISGNQTIVSKGGIFELGFFTPGKSNNYYIGIWYKKIPTQTVVWVANREKPVSNPATSELKLAKDGNLVISHSKLPVWSSNTTSPSSSSSISIIATLLDTGNLVLRDQSNSSIILWQSFDHPTDTCLPNGWVGVNKITGEYQSLTSWRNTEDPSPGLFTKTIDPSGIHQLILQWNKSRSYWRSGVWNGKSFTLMPEMDGYNILRSEFVDNNKSRYYSYNFSDGILGRTLMHSSGQAQQWMWFNDEQGWVLVWAEPLSLCDIYSVCGTFGMCDNKDTPVCSCPSGFSPTSMRDWELEDWSSGCSRKTHLQCNDRNSTTGEKDGFLAIPNLLLPADSQPVATTSAEECEVACLNNCSCTAYSHGNGCSIWYGDIKNLKILSEGENRSGTLYLRLAASDLPRTGKRKLIIKIALSATVAIVLLTLMALIWICRRKGQGTSKFPEGPLVSFTYNELRRMTKNFSEKLGGGGFGLVFKGILSNSDFVAVKRLEGVRQGEKEFRNELGTLGRIQHVNLVRLRGFCCEGTEKILVYDYMPMGSLDHHLFQKQSKNLDWKTRYQIILGTARGLAYLHEECRECIIHCDIKPENVLLDTEFCPKLSDFGMAKLIGHDFSRVLTTMRGTIGYLAPEWIEGLPITPKADVYSYGMMLFEIVSVSGRRNSKLAEDGSIRYFPVQAASKLITGEVLSLLDEDLNGSADALELNRVCRVACWCIQDFEADRPSMVEVINVLEGVLELKMPPFPRTLQRLAEEVSIVSYYE
ncbi:G-type lectin S-receptor-like serine/threonine-protein kinase At2g19130 [Asparagus officinalis]|uniref:G-type lectin S-receptor-like serine/threonine-protein kinase At2g19130 n=1 Tax=Asparagus officinalis TaxID=4686 RepID=UPI00098DEC4A|nr:G-type lectin S-receptor-like serine/threonine-protein kinase At2g19130 [Asparagus officinalis]